MDLLLIDRLRGQMFDLIHHVDTYRPASLHELDVVGGNKQFGTEYRSTMPKSLRAVLKGLRESKSGATFVDVGSGKGCTLLVASRFPFQKIIGIEFASELCQIAQKNIRNYRGSQACKKISVLQMDATQFSFPDGPLLVYFFNPFHTLIMEKVLQNLAQSIADNPRPVTVVCDALYHRDAIMSLFRPQMTRRICGFSVYTNTLDIPSQESKRSL